MQWFLALTAALLLAQSQGERTGSSSPCLDGPCRRDAVTSDTPLVDMTDADIGTLVTSLMEEFEAAGFTCPGRAKATLTLGLMVPRIPLSFATLRQRMFELVGRPVDLEVQDKVTEQVMGFVERFFRPMERMPELPGMVENIGDILEKLDELEHDLVKSPEDGGTHITGSDIRRRLRSVIESLKMIGCEKMLTEKKVARFVQRVKKILALDEKVILFPKVLYGIKKAMTRNFPDDPDLALKVTEEVIDMVRFILTDIRSTADGMVATLPDLPLNIFINNIVRMAHPRTNEVRRAVSPAGIKFPDTTDACYEQKLSAYNAVLLGWFNRLRVRAVASLLPGTDRAMVKIIKELLPRITPKVLRPLLRSSRRAAGRVLKELIKNRSLNEQSMVKPINKLLTSLQSNKLCQIPPAAAVSNMSVVYLNASRKFDDAFMQELRGKTGVTDPALKDQLKSQTAAFKVVFDAMYQDFKTNNFTELPLKALVSLINNMGSKPVKRVFSDLSVEHVLEEYGLNGGDVITSFNAEQLRLVFETLTEELEGMIPINCKKEVALSITKGLMRTIIRTKVQETIRATNYLLSHAVTPEKVTITRMKKYVRTIITQYIKNIMKRLPKKDLAKLERQNTYIKMKEVNKMTSYDFLQSMLERANAQVEHDVERCETRKTEPKYTEWSKFMEGIIEKLNNGVKKERINKLLAKVFKNDQKSIDRVGEVLVTSLTTLYEDLAATLKPLATLEDQDIVRDTFIEYTVSRIHSQPMPANPATSPKKRSMEGIELFRHPLFRKIVSKYSQIASKMLSGNMSQHVSQEMIEEMIHGVAESILTRHSGEIGHYDDSERLEHLLEILDGISMDTVPSDVIHNTVSTMARHIQKSVPEHCRLPMMVKFITAFVRLQNEDLLSTSPDHPLLHLLAPVLQGSNPQYHITLEKVITILSELLPQLHSATSAAMRDLDIFYKTEPVESLLSEVISDVKPGESTSDRYRHLLPRLIALLQDPALCRPVEVSNVIREGSEFLERLRITPDLSRMTLDMVLKETLPDDMERQVIVGSVSQVALPMIYSFIADFMTRCEHMLRHPDMFPEFFSNTIVETLGLEMPPLQRFLHSNVYRLFSEELKMGMMSELMPMSKIPHEELSRLLYDAYRKTLDILQLHP